MIPSQAEAALNHFARDSWKPFGFPDNKGWVEHVRIDTDPRRASYSISYVVAVPEKVGHQLSPGRKQYWSATSVSHLDLYRGGASETLKILADALRNSITEVGLHLYEMDPRIGHQAFPFNRQMAHPSHMGKDTRPLPVCPPLDPALPNLHQPSWAGVDPNGGETKPEGPHQCILCGASFQPFEPVFWAGGNLHWIDRKCFSEIHGFDPYNPYTDPFAKQDTTESF